MNTLFDTPRTVVMLCLLTFFWTKMGEVVWWLPMQDGLLFLKTNRFSSLWSPNMYTYRMAVKRGR
jgi:hypothetical protein